MVKLIIDQYNTPAYIISKYIYNKEDIPIVITGEMSSFYKKLSSEPNSMVYSIHEEEASEEIKYYFIEICTVDNDIVSVYNKYRNRVRYYEILRDMDDSIVDIIPINEKVLEKEKNVVKNLPYTEAQEGTVVLFPSDEE